MPRKVRNLPAGFSVGRGGCHYELSNSDANEKNKKKRPRWRPPPSARKGRSGRKKQCSPMTNECNENIAKRNVTTDNDCVRNSNNDSTIYESQHALPSFVANSSNSTGCDNMQKTNFDCETE
jgi:hypothetical protein